MRDDSPNLDFIRTVAVLAVALRHLLGALGLEQIGPFRVHLLGIYGVALFFVHTAHVLMWSLERMSQNQPSGLYARFLARRAFRIYPLSAFVVMLGFGLTRITTVPGFASLGVGDMLANLLLVQNITHSPDAIGVLWSLPLEVQMYLLLPALFMLVRGGSVLASVIVYAVGITLAAAAYKFGLPQVFKFFPCFLPGVLAFAIMRRGAARRWPAWALPLVLLAAWLVYEVVGAWSQTVGSYLPCLAVGLLVPFVRESQWPRLNAVYQTVAKYSYGVYMVHVPVLALTFAAPVPAALRVPIFLAGTWALSVLAYRLIEEPMVLAGKAITSGAALAPRVQA